MSEFSLNQLFLQDDSPQLPYHEKSGSLAWPLHWGQRKLLINLMYFVSKYAQSNSRVDVIYMGAAPGHNINILLDIFPNIHWHLFDEEPIVVREDPRTNIHQRYFLEQDVDTWNKKAPESIVLLVSDIRNLGMKSAQSTSSQEQQIRNYWTKRQELPETSNSDKLLIDDQQLQRTWVERIRPTAAMLKFRTPFVTGTEYEYLDGQVMFQPWVGPSSSETRLIIERPDGEYKTRQYSVAVFSNQLFYHNQVSRERGITYINPITHQGEMIDEPEFINFWDETAELAIWHVALPNASYEDIKNWMKKTTSLLSWYIKNKMALSDNTQAYQYVTDKTMIQRRYDRWIIRLTYGSNTAESYRRAFNLQVSVNKTNTISNLIGNQMIDAVGRGSSSRQIGVGGQTRSIGMGSVGMGAIGFGAITDEEIETALMTLIRPKIPNFTPMTPQSFLQALADNKLDGGAMQYLSLAVNTITNDPSMRRQWLNQLILSSKPAKSGSRVIRQLGNVALIADTDDKIIRRQAWLGLSILNSYRTRWPNFQYTLGSFPCSVGTTEYDGANKPTDICIHQEDGWYVMLENNIQFEHTNAYNLNSVLSDDKQIIHVKNAIIQVVLALWQAYQDSSFHHGNLIPTTINILSLNTPTHFIYRMGLDYVLTTNVIAQIVDFSVSQARPMNREFTVGSAKKYDESTDIRNLLGHISNRPDLPTGIRTWIQKWYQKLNTPRVTYPDWILSLLNEHSNIVRPYIFQPNNLINMQLAASSSQQSGSQLAASSSQQSGLQLGASYPQQSKPMTVYHPPPTPESLMNLPSQPQPQIRAPSPLIQSPSARQQQSLMVQQLQQQQATGQNPISQPQQSMGQPQQSMGQPQQSMGQPQSSLGQQQSSLGQSQPSLGQSQPSLGQPPLGQPQSSLGQPQSSLGQQQSSLGQQQSSLGQQQSSLLQAGSNIRFELQGVVYRGAAVVYEGKPALKLTSGPNNTTVNIVLLLNNVSKDITLPLKKQYQVASRNTQTDIWELMNESTFNFFLE